MSGNNFDQMVSAIRQIKNKQRSGSIAQPNVDYSARQAPSVDPPAARPPSDAEFYIDNHSHGRQLLPNAPLLKNHFTREGRLTEAQALFILEGAEALLRTEPNLLQISGSTTVCGDIHGQYYDLLKLFEVGGSLSENKYLFLGDYVDRGSFGIECLLYLYALKLNNPTSVFLLRGNHECRHLTEFFTFKRECFHKYGKAVYDAALKSFQALPIAAVLDNRFFCVHGGLSPELNTLKDLANMDRFKEPGSHGLLCDMLWSDPTHDFSTAVAPPTSPTGGKAGYTHNATRGCSYFFSYEATVQFLERNKLLSVIRGHEAQDQGYHMYKKTPRNFPAVITIFSAPNYLDAYQNRGAVLKYVNKNIVLRQFNSSPHPYWLPNFMDAFTWSLPFVGSKIAEMFLAILAICSEEELVESDESDSDAENRLANVALREEAQERREKIRNKVLAVGRMARAFKILREEAENVSEFNTLSDEFDIESGVGGASRDEARHRLGVGGQRIVNQIHGFSDARRFDIANERLPTYVSPSDAPLEETFPSPSTRPRTPTPQQPFARAGSPTPGFLYRDGEDEEEIRQLADRVARIRSTGGRYHGARPDTLRRFDTI